MTADILSTMVYRALACDYDGTIASQGRVDQGTLAALERVRASGRSLVLVTGRQLEDLNRVFERLDVFARVVAENGALLYRPAGSQERSLGPRPAPKLISELRRRGVSPLEVGRVILATREPHQSTVLQTIREMRLGLHVILNKGAVMVLPVGVNKAAGLQVALDELGVSFQETVGVGDAENDRDFLARCGYSAAVANALPELKQEVDYVAAGGEGSGVVELIEQLWGPELPLHVHARHDPASPGTSA
jgi:HAD superfamily hydrolase (TIGR01484 family)